VSDWGAGFFSGIGGGGGAPPSAVRIARLLDGSDWAAGFFSGIGGGGGAPPSAVRIARLLDGIAGETSFPRILFVWEIGPKQ
jgi:hypothetical protein